MTRGRARYLATLFGVLAYVLVSQVQGQEWQESVIDVGGIERVFRVYLPKDLPAKAPIVLSLHGGLGSMYSIDKGASHGWVRLAGEKQFLLLVPNGTDAETGDPRGQRQNWNDLRTKDGERQSRADDVSFISALLDHVQQQYGTDPDRVFVTGNSNGGLMTYRLLIERSDRFAAAAAFIANIPAESSLLRPPGRPVPLLIWSGKDDRLMKYEGGQIARGRGITRPTPENLAWWLKANGAETKNAHTEQLTDVDPKDGCRIERTLYRAGPAGAPVLFYLAHGAGHTMPTQTERTSEGGPLQRMIVGPTCHDVDGPTIAWEFMSTFSRHGPN